LLWWAAGVCVVVAVAATAAMLSTRPQTMPKIEPVSVGRAAGNDIDREVALQLLEAGHCVGLFTNSKHVEIRVPGDLPEAGVQVRTVRISMSKPTEEQWRALTQLAALNRLNIAVHPDGEGFQIDDHDAEQIAQCRALTNLFIDSTSQKGHHRISDHGLMQISNLDGLTSLVVNSQLITDAGLAHLTQLTKLTQLGLKLHPTANITAGGMAHVAALPGLTHLTLSGSVIDDNCMEPVAQSTSLIVLRLVFARVGARGYVALSTCRTLNRLEVHHSRMTRTDLDAMASITQLRRLEITGLDELADPDLLALTPLTNLQVAVFSKCPQLTDAGLEALRQALPGCYVDRDRPPEG
jgi:hypothetical protein